MKESSKIVVIGIVSAFVGVGCSADVGESNMAEEELSGRTVRASKASTPPNALANDSVEELGASSDALVARINVEAICEVIKVKENVYCPPKIVGHGWTRPPIISCPKAHDRAIEDARSQLGDGCSLGSCQFFGC